LLKEALGVQLSAVTFDMILTLIAKAGPAGREKPSAEC